MVCRFFCVLNVADDFGRFCGDNRRVDFHSLDPHHQVQDMRRPAQGEIPTQHDIRTNST